MSAISFSSVSYTHLVTFDKLGSFRGEDPRADRIKAMRDMVKKEIGKLQKLAGDAEDQKFMEEIAATTGTVVYLFLAVQSFEKTYSAKKREKNVLDLSLIHIFLHFRQFLHKVLE